MRRMRSIVRLALLALVLAALGCSSGGGSSSTTGPTGTGTGGDGSSGGGTGTMTVFLTDSPFSDAQSLLLTFSEVSIHRSGAGWETLTTASMTCDLKKLVNAQTVLVTSPLPAGHFTQIRLMVSSATLYFDNAAAGPACAPIIAAPAGQSAPVEIPSGEIKLNRDFDLAAGGATTVTLDFDGDSSVRQTGNGTYMMQPVVAILSVQ